MDVTKDVKLGFDTMGYSVEEFHTPNMLTSASRITIPCTDGKCSSKPFTLFILATPSNM